MEVNETKSSDFNEKSIQPDTDLLPLPETRRLSESEVSYMDLYLSVSESLYRASRINYSSESLSDSNETSAGEETINLCNYDNSVMIPCGNTKVVNAEWNRSVDPLSATASFNDDFIFGNNNSVNIDFLKCLRKFSKNGKVENLESATSDHPLECFEEPGSAIGTDGESLRMTASFSHSKISESYNNLPGVSDTKSIDVCAYDDKIGIDHSYCDSRDNKASDGTIILPNSTGSSTCVDETQIDPFSATAVYMDMKMSEMNIGVDSVAMNQLGSSSVADRSELKLDKSSKVNSCDSSIDCDVKYNEEDKDVNSVTSDQPIKCLDEPRSAIEKGKVLESYNNLPGFSEAKSIPVCNFDDKICIENNLSVFDHSYRDSCDNKTSDGSIILPDGTGSSTCVDETQVDPFSATAVYMDMKMSEMNIGDHSVNMSHIGFVSSAERSKSKLDKCSKVNSCDSSIDCDAKSVLEDDSSGIGSLLMLSTELGDSLFNETGRSYEKDIEGSKPVETNLFISDYSKPNGLTESTIILKRNLNSNETNNVSKLSVNDPDVNKSIFASEMPNFDRFNLNSVVNNSLDNYGDTSIDLNNFVEWLPSMKTQLKRLLLYITSTGKNTALENTVANLTMDIDKLKGENQELCGSSFANEADKILKDNLKVLKQENDSLKLEIETLSDNCMLYRNNYDQAMIEINSLKNQIELCKNDYESLNRLKQSLQSSYDNCNLEKIKTEIHLKDLKNKNASQNDEIGSVKNEFDILKIKFLNSTEEIDYLNERFEKINYDFEALKNIHNMCDSTTEKLRNERELLQSNLTALNFENVSLKNEITDLKNKCLQDQNEIDDLKNKLCRIQDLTDELHLLKDNQNKLERIIEEKETLSLEMRESKRLFQTLLNVQIDCSLQEMVMKCQQQFYNLTLLEEKLEKEKLNSEELKNANTFLKDENQILAVRVGSLQKELNKTADELNGVRKDLNDLSQKNQILKKESEDINPSLKDQGLNSKQMSNANYHVFENDSSSSYGNKGDHCINCDKKFREMLSILIDRNAQISSLQLEKENLKSRYYNKSQSLKNTEQELIDLKILYSKLEKNNRTMATSLKEFQCAKVVRDVAVQCKEELERHPPPANFVQVCKIQELSRKLEKLHNVYKLEKEKSKKKDDRISVLNKELTNLSKLSLSNISRTCLEDKTNITPP